MLLRAPVGVLTPICLWEKWTLTPQPNLNPLVYRPNQKPLGK